MIKLNGVEIKPTIFPDGTSQVWKLPDDLIQHENHVEWEFQHEGEFMHLAQLKMLLDSTSGSPKGAKVELYIPYLPYARQDKVVSNQTTFSLLTFSRLLNSLDFDKVSSLDVHSPLAGVGIDRFESISPSKGIDKAIRKLMNKPGKFLEPRTEIDLMVGYPDAGASARYGKSDDIAIIGNKTRDQSSGFITDYSIEGDPSGKDILVIDDICDGGMTFILFAKELLTAGAKSVNLYVTHGIFSKGLRPLKEAGIDRIFTRLGEASEIKTGIGRSVAYKEIK